MHTTDVYTKNANAATRVVMNQGGTRSSKTYSLLQLFISRAITGRYKGKIVSIVRKTFRSMTNTVMRDFYHILKADNYYSIHNENKTHHTYMLNGCLFEFFGADDEDKLKGGKRHILYCNEANAIGLGQFEQLNMRTTEQVFMDLNPSDPYWWGYDTLKPREDCTFIHSTYLDNNHLTEIQIKEIERYKVTDPLKWKIYGLGEIGYSEATIYTNWSEVATIPDGRDAIGIDFGFNVPSSVVLVTKHDGDLYARCLVYEKELTNTELIERMKRLNVSKTTPIFADAAEPDRIKEIKKAGFNVRKAIKDVNFGIDEVKSHRLFIHTDSTDLLDEVKAYKWIESPDGRVLDKPVKENDHALDALRYAVVGMKKTSSKIGGGFANPTK